MQIMIAFYNIISNSFLFFVILMMSAKLAILGLLKLMVF